MTYNVNLTKVLVKRNKNKFLFVHEVVLNELLKDLPEKEKKHLDKWLYINHKMNREYQQNEDIDGVTLNAKLLQKILSKRRQKQIMDWYLEEKKFIKKVKNYSAGNHSNVYAYTDKIKYCSIIPVLMTDKNLMDKLIKSDIPKTYLEEYAGQCLKMIRINYDDAYYSLQRLTFSEIEIDEMVNFFERAQFSTNFKEYFNNNTTTTSNTNYNTNNNYSTIYVSTFLKEESKKKKNNPVFKFALSNALLGSIYAGDLRCHRDPNVTRLHSNLTVLKRELRKHLYVPGLDLVELDIANSQPLILNTIYGKNKGYLHLCETGQLWDYLMQKCEVSDRKKFKHDMFGEVFYCSLWGMMRSEKSKIFKAEFPDVWQFIYDYKKENGKESLPIAMQRKEAEIILDTVCIQLANRSIWFATIHDSIIVDAKYAIYVRKIIEESFYYKFKIEPQIRIEKL